jgi:hypothetical protein
MLAAQNPESLNKYSEGRINNSENLSDFCTDRYFERLPGFIDVKILTTEGTNAEKGHFLDPPMPSAYPICHLKPLSEDKLAIFAELKSQAT